MTASFFFFFKQMISAEVRMFKNLLTYQYPWGMAINTCTNGHRQGQKSDWIRMDNKSESDQFGMSQANSGQPKVYIYSVKIYKKTKDVIKFLKW